MESVFGLGLGRLEGTGQDGHPGIADRLKGGRGIMEVRPLMND